MADHSDNDLLIKIKEDNQSAFEVIFLKYYSGLCSYASTILGQDDAGEETVQDVFVRIWENRKSLDINSSMKAYLYRTVHNHCLNQLENRKVRNLYSRSQSQQNEQNHWLIPFSGEYPIANLILKELENKVQQAIDALPEQCREVFVLIRFGKKSYQETAQKLNISINTA
jgi:RNA polymerase sigma-70 factor (ECF subfamily)